MRRRVDLPFDERRGMREENFYERQAGWHNGPSLVTSMPKTPTIHPEITRMWQLMQANQLAREAKLRAEFERKLGQGRAASSPA